MTSYNNNSNNSNNNNKNTNNANNIKTCFIIIDIDNLNEPAKLILVSKYMVNVKGLFLVVGGFGQQGMNAAALGSKRHAGEEAFDVNSKRRAASMFYLVFIRTSR